jgi:thiol:disulfide interchange protein DsbA
MELHARMFYANEALGLTEQLHWPIFEAMNKDGKRFADEDEVLDWVEDQGVDPESYRRALNSFGVTSQVNQVQTKMAQYRVRGTPEMVINGKYHLTTTMAKTQENMLVIAKALVAQEQAAAAN